MLPVLISCRMKDKAGSDSLARVRCFVWRPATSIVRYRSGSCLKQSTWESEWGSNMCNVSKDLSNKHVISRLHAPMSNGSRHEATRTQLPPESNIDIRERVALLSPHAHIWYTACMYTVYMYVCIHVRLFACMCACIDGCVFVCFLSCLLGPAWPGPAWPACLLARRFVGSFVCCLLAAWLTGWLVRVDGWMDGWMDAWMERPCPGMFAVLVGHARPHICVHLTRVCACKDTPVHSHRPQVHPRGVPKPGACVTDDAGHELS